MSKRRRSCGKDEEEDDERAAGGKRARTEPTQYWLSFMEEDGGCFQHFFTHMLDAISQRALCCVDRAHCTRLIPMRLPLLALYSLDTRYIKYKKKVTLYQRLSTAIEYDHDGAFAAAWVEAHTYLSLRRYMVEKLVVCRAFRCASTLLAHSAFIFSEDVFNKDFIAEMLPFVPARLLPSYIRNCLGRIGFKSTMLRILKEPIPEQDMFISALLDYHNFSLAPNIRAAIDEYYYSDIPSQNVRYLTLIHALSQLKESPSGSSSSAEDSSSSSG